MLKIGTRHSRRCPQRLRPLTTGRSRARESLALFAPQSLLKDRLLRSAKRERNLIEPGDLKQA